MHELVPVTNADINVRMPTHETLLLFLKCLCSESDLPKKKKMKVINVYNDEIASFRGFRLTYGNNFADKSLFLSAVTI